MGLESLLVTNKERKNEKMKTVLLVGAAVAGGTIATAMVADMEFAKKFLSDKKPGTRTAIQSGATAAISTAFFAVLSNAI